MITVFIEYKIFETSKSIFFQERKFVQAELKKYEISQYQFLEAIDQPFLYVESFKIPNIEIYQQWKLALEEQSGQLPWEPIIKYIAGGRKKFNMWAFRAVPLIQNGERTT